jgi:hypothetical protein
MVMDGGGAHAVEGVMLLLKLLLLPTILARMTKREGLRLARIVDDEKLMIRLQL